MTTRWVLAVAAMLLVVSVAAQGTAVEIKPGTVAADSSLHGIDVTVDDLLVRADMKDPSNVAFERASEMRDLQERNKDTPERLESLSTSVEKNSQISVNTAGGENIKVNDNGISISGSDGSISINDKGISISGPDGSVNIGKGGIDVSGSDGSVSISDGKINVKGPDGSVSIDAEGIKVEAENRQNNLKKTRIVIENVHQNAPGDVQQRIQTTVEQVSKNEQDLERLQNELDQKMQEFR